MRSSSGAGGSTADNDERADYIKAKLEQLQRGLVTFKSSKTNMVDSSIWISRSTACDVISVVTTVQPVKNGDMKDIRQHNKEMRRIRAPVARPPGKMLPGNPFEEGLVVNEERLHQRNCSLLRKERKEFMEKLRTSRYIRTVVENSAVITIQKMYRRHWVLRHWGSIRDECLVHKRLRAAVKEYLLQPTTPADQKQLLLLNPAKHRENYRALRFKSARRIQCLFRKFMSRRVLRYRRYQLFQLKRRNAAVKIQCLARKSVSIALVKLLHTRRKVSRYAKSALLIQTHVRKMFARRLVRKVRYKFRTIAARMIQCWYRSHHSKWKASKIKELVMRERRFIGALGLQGLVRRRVARQRVNRLRLRRLYLYVFMASLKIQCMVRKKLSLLRVRRVRAERARARKEKEAQDKAATAEAEAKASSAAAAAAASKAEFNDIYAQIRLGDTKRVEDIFHGAGGACDARDPTHVDAKGDTLLTLAAALGNPDLVSKCIAWQLDVNHRNAEGLNSLMLAAKYDHAVVDLLLSAEIKMRLNFAALIQDDAAFLLLATLDAAGRATKKSGSAPEHLERLQALLGVHGLGGSINSKDARYHNMSPVHLAAYTGNADVFSLIIKSRPHTDVVDDRGHTPLHSACQSPCAQVDIVKTLLGLDAASTGVIVPEPKRAAALQARDKEGKDCLVLAALAGQTAVLLFAQDFLRNDAFSKGSASGDVAAAQAGITWTDADVHATLRLAETGNDVCLAYLLQVGLDPTRATADAGTTVSMAACLHGHLIFVNVLLDHGVKLLGQKDIKGQTAMHYAAACASAGTLVAHLLVHERASDCGVTGMSLAAQDEGGLTPLHVAAVTGVEVSVELLARRGVQKALATRDFSTEGLTPLLTAAKHQNRNVLALYLRMTDDVAAVLDHQGRNALWWFMHPSLSALAPVPTRRPPSSEFLSRRGLQSKMGKKEKDDAAQALEADVEAIKTLLRAGCPLYSAAAAAASPEQLLALPFNAKAGEAPSLEQRQQLEAGDLLAAELSLTALKAVPECLSKKDAWRLGTLPPFSLFLPHQPALILTHPPLPFSLPNSFGVHPLRRRLEQGAALAARGRLRRRAGRGCDQRQVFRQGCLAAGQGLLPRRSQPTGLVHFPRQCDGPKAGAQDWL